MIINVKNDENMGELDAFYRDRIEMDRSDPKDRIALVRYGGFTCDQNIVQDDDCAACPAAEWCEWAAALKKLRQGG